MSVSGSPTYWPSMSDYQEAVQAPKLCFPDADLATSTPVMNKLGLPRPICGQFASVYELEKTGERWAIKCFLRNIPDQHSRYAKISTHLGKCNLPYFMTFEYVQKGIRCQGKLFPIVKMDWIEGLALNQYIENNLSDRSALEGLEKRWLTLLEDLQSVDVAHGDLQHGNVLVAADGNFRLIDYDGMWVPKLKGQKSHETGHPNFQSPLRCENDFDSGIDQFAGDVIHVALRALQRKPDLWKKYDNADNLLFKRQDFENPSQSVLIAEVRALGDPESDGKLDSLIAACGGKPKRGGVGRFFKPKRSKTAAPPKDLGKSWKKAQAPQPPPPPPPPPPPKPAVAKAVAPRAVAKAAQQQPLRGGIQPSGGAGSWLTDHTAARPVAVQTASAPRPRPKPQARSTPGVAAIAPPAIARGPKPPLGHRLLGHLRLLVHLFLVAPVITAAVMDLLTMLDGFGDRATAILMSGFGIAGVLGLLSILSIFLGRVIHKVVSTLFFGLTALIMFLSILSSLLTDGWSEWTGEDPLQCALMLTMLTLSGVGLLVEYACRRKGVETRWRPPWA